MKRCFPVMMVIALILLCFAGPAMAAGAQWKITLNNDRSISESVTGLSSLPAPADSWTTSPGSKDLNRKIGFWDTYGKQADRLPIDIIVEDYILWQNVKIQTTALPANAPAFSTVANQPLQLTIQFPAAIKKANGAKMENERTAVWQLDSGSSLQNRGVLLEATLLDGFITSIALFILAFIGIAIFYFRKVSKTHKLIEKEYSLENLDEEKDEIDQDDDKD
ncbi:MAG: hypothetical protein ABRQ26_14440 [Syntrophomonadaceae bacterium]